MIDYSFQARILAGGIALLAALTLVTHIDLGLTRHPDRTVLAELWRVGRYFTILTTLLAMTVFAKIALTGRISQHLAAGVTLWTAIVAIVYHGLLARDLVGLRWYVDQGMHTAVPLAVGLWWLRYASTDTLRYWDALWWLGWPGLYMSYALVRGEIDGRHPYFFIDPPLIGWPKVLMWIPTLGLVFWLFGLALVWLGLRLSRGRPHPTDAAPSGPPPR